METHDDLQKKIEDVSEGLQEEHEGDDELPKKENESEHQGQMEELEHVDEEEQDHIDIEEHQRRIEELVPKGEGEEDNVLQIEPLKLESDGRVDGVEDEELGRLNVGPVLEQHRDEEEEEQFTMEDWRAQVDVYLTECGMVRTTAAIDKEKKIYFEAWQRRERLGEIHAKWDQYDALVHATKGMVSLFKSYAVVWDKDENTYVVLTIGKRDSGHHTYEVDVKKVAMHEDGYYHVVNDAPCELRNAVKLSNNLLKMDWVDRVHYSEDCMQQDISVEPIKVQDTARVEEESSERMELRKREKGVLTPLKGDEAVTVHTSKSSKGRKGHHHPHHSHQHKPNKKPPDAKIVQPAVPEEKKAPPTVPQEKQVLPTAPEGKTENNSDVSVKNDKINSFAGKTGTESSETNGMEVEKESESHVDDKVMKRERIEIEGIDALNANSRTKKAMRLSGLRLRLEDDRNARKVAEERKAQHEEKIDEIYQELDEFLSDEIDLLHDS